MDPVANADWKIGDKVLFKNVPPGKQATFNDDYYGILMEVQENEGVRQDVLRHTGIEEMNWPRLEVWKVERVEKSTNQRTLKSVPACWLGEYTEDTECHTVELTTGDWNFEIDRKFTILKF